MTRRCVIITDGKRTMIRDTPPERSPKWRGVGSEQVKKVKHLRRVK
jgi:hypothetical protein